MHHPSNVPHLFHLRMPDADIHLRTSRRSICNHCTKALTTILSLPLLRNERQPQLPRFCYTRRGHCLSSAGNARLWRGFAFPFTDPGQSIFCDSGLTLCSFTLNTQFIRWPQPCYSRPVAYRSHPISGTQAGRIVLIHRSALWTADIDQRASPQSMSLCIAIRRNRRSFT